MDGLEQRTAELAEQFSAAYERIAIDEQLADEHEPATHDTLWQIPVTCIVRGHQSQLGSACMRCGMWLFDDRVMRR